MLKESDDIAELNGYDGVEDIGHFVADARHSDIRRVSHRHWVGSRR
jgi:hypothetical protein